MYNGLYPSSKNLRWLISLCEKLLAISSHPFTHLHVILIVMIFNIISTPLLLDEQEKRAYNNVGKMRLPRFRE